MSADPFAPTPQDDLIPSPRGFDEDDIPTIDDGMIDHGERVDFEHKMSAVPVLSLAIIAACVVAFVAQAIGGGLSDLDTLIRMGALHEPAVSQDGEWWRLVSSTFLHGGLDHLIGNMLMLYVLGMACEHGFGRPQFLFLYIGAGIIGASFSLMGGKPSVGASGAIFGLAGALIVLFYRFRSRLHLRDARVGLVLIVWALYTLAIGHLNPAVDNLAHLGGLLGGAALAFLLRPAVLDGRAAVASRPLTIAGAATALLALLASAAFFLPRLASAG